jgi:hypothetical protein
MKLDEDWSRVYNKKINQWMFDGIPINTSDPTRPYSGFLERIKKDGTFHDYDFLNYIYTDKYGNTIFDKDIVEYYTDKCYTEFPRLNRFNRRVVGEIQYNGRSLCPTINNVKVEAGTYENLFKKII